MEAGGATTAIFSPGARGCYDFTCHGPNGFRRRFAGAADVRLEAASRIDPSDLSLQVRLRNGTEGAATFTLVGDAQTRVREVPPGGSRTETFHPLARSQGWYDLTVTADRDERFLRVMAGHLENGLDSVTGP